MRHPPVSEALHSDAVDVLTHWEPPSPDQDLLRTDYLNFLTAHGDAMSRGNRTGHITGSALVVDPAGGRVLLTLHPLVGRWLQLGGHVESDDVSLVEAALREAREESGLLDLEIDGAPLRLDRHRVRCRDGHGGEDLLDHLDVQFLVSAQPGARARRSSESLDLRWWPYEDLPAVTDGSVRALVQEARVRLGA
jgi:8-oxo-dGTP pyrophosphatase MutT (NUDIX family)